MTQLLRLDASARDQGSHSRDVADFFQAPSSSIKHASTAPCETGEVASKIRSEFRKGEIVEMTGGTPAPNELVGALIAMLRLALNRQPSSSQSLIFDAIMQADAFQLTYL